MAKPKAKHARPQEKQSKLKAQNRAKADEPTSQPPAAEPPATTGKASERPSTIFFWKDDEVPYGFFCQWYRCKFMDPESGLTFNCAEQWMMWSKARMAGDDATARTIMATSSPRKQKQLGREVEGFEEAEWDKIRSDVVERGNYLKFTQCTNVASLSMNETREPSTLKVLMLATGNKELAEASRFDRVWGIGFSEDDAESQPRSKWGENLLGQALMKVRERIRLEE
ncbi:MAG: hypothetical protein M1831_002935 [Alyxoria varia]|nr:MAG: hypothetical protein M1831_002935 [Alyxoria varia]